MALIVMFLGIVLLTINCQLGLSCQPLNPPIYLGPSAAGRLPLQLNGPGAAKFHDGQVEGPSAKEIDGTLEMPKLNRIGKVGDDKLFGENSQLLKMNIVRRIEGEKAALFDPVPTTTEVVPTTTTLTTTPALPPFGGCQPNTASVLAVTNIPYQEATVQQEFNALMSKLGLLETFVGFKLASFGNHFVQPIKEGQNFALRIYFTNAVGDCDQMRDFTGKTVSYSKEIEYAIFSCRCGEAWMISKIH